MPFLADLFGGGGAPNPPAPPPLPSQAIANQAGQTTVANQRAAMLAAGGLTDQTGGLGALLGSDIQKPSLTGY